MSDTVYSSDDEEYQVYKGSQEGWLYFSKLFQYNRGGDIERDPLKRNVKFVIDGQGEVQFGQIEDAFALRFTGEKRRTMVTAVVSVDPIGIQRVTISKFVNNKFPSGDIRAYRKESFTFRSGELNRFVEFLNYVHLVDLKLEDKFKVEVTEGDAKSKVLIDAGDRQILDALKHLDANRRRQLLEGLSHDLSKEDINIILGRKNALTEMKVQLDENVWNEKDWQNFFEKQNWIFGYGIDYRIMREFDRELTLSGSGTDNKNKPVVDFFQTFSNYTTIVEIKKPDSKIFNLNQSGSRSGTWALSNELNDAVTQVLAQKSAWLSNADRGDHFSRDGTRRLEARTKDLKAILVIGSTKEIDRVENDRDRQVMMDTFELYRRNMRNVDILTYDELLERAEFIVKQEK